MWRRGGTGRGTGPRSLQSLVASLPRDQLFCLTSFPPRGRKEPNEDDDGIFPEAQSLVLKESLAQNLSFVSKEQRKDGFNGLRQWIRPEKTD